MATTSEKDKKKENALLSADIARDVARKCLKLCCSTQGKPAQPRPGQASVAFHQRKPSNWRATFRRRELRTIWVILFMSHDSLLVYFFFLFLSLSSLPLFSLLCGNKREGLEGKGQKSRSGARDKDANEKQNKARSYAILFLSICSVIFHCFMPLLFHHVAVMWKMEKRIVLGTRTLDRMNGKIV